MSKDELRAQIEKLQQTNTTLRAKSREAVRAGKAAAAHIEELEAQIEQLERKLSQRNMPAKPAAKKASSSRSVKAAPPQAEPPEVEPPDAEPPEAEPIQTSADEVEAAPAKTARRGRRRREIDPGDGVPPGIAVAEPAPEDEEARTMRENLEAHLGGS